MRRRDITLSCTLILFQACSPVINKSSGSAERKQSPAYIRVADCDGPALSLPAELKSSLAPRTGQFDPDDHWADLAERIPGGFAGILYDAPSGKPTIMLTHPEHAAEVKQALVSDRSFRHFDIMGAQVLKARWDFAQLVDWYNYLVLPTSVWSTEGMVSGDKNEETNRIEFGIETESGRRRLVEKLKDLRIPCDLVLIRIAGKARPLEPQIIPRTSRSDASSIVRSSGLR